MKKALIHLEYLPSVSWFSKFIKYEQVLIERHENFVKSTGRNRCRIAGANGVQLLSIPLDGGRDHHRLYSQLNISYKADWQSVHWHSIVSAYGSTPYFEHYSYKLQPFYEQQYISLFDYNVQLLRVILKMLKIESEVMFTETYTKVPDGMHDLRVSKNEAGLVDTPPYYQIFADRNGFIPNLSIIDLIFHKGPEAKGYLMKM